MRINALFESPWGRLGALIVGWFAALLAAVMISGHGLWRTFGARTLHWGLAQAAIACVFADAVFLLVIFGRGRGTASRTTMGFFAGIGVAMTFPLFSGIREMWVSGVG